MQLHTQEQANTCRVPHEHKNACAHIHKLHRGLRSWFTACVWMLKRSQGSFPRNLWHKLPLSHYLMTKHSHKPPPMLLLNFTLRARVQKKVSPHSLMCACTHLHRKTLSQALSWLQAEDSYCLKSLSSDDFDSKNLFMNEVRTGRVILCCFQEASTPFSMALFVLLNCNMSISFMKAPL